MRILKIESLPKVSPNIWIDRDEIMLHACFQILKDCVEKESVDTDCNYEANKEFVDEVRFLYQWWESRKDKERKYETDKQDTEMLIRLMKIRTQLWT